MNNDNWHEEQKKKDKLNNLLENAALNGVLTQVMNLTINEEYKEIVNPACGGNYPLRGASLRGHIPVVDFLVNFPDEEKRVEITSNNNIIGALCLAIEHGQDEVCLYFKNNTPEAYQEFINKGPHNSPLNVAAMRGYLSTIKLIAEDVIDKSNWDYNLFIESSVKYNHPECFEYFLKNFDKEKFNDEKNLIDIAHTILYNQQFEMLEKIMDNSNLNLNKHITVQHFRILTEVKFDSLKHIVEKYNYEPNKKVMEQVNNYLSKKEDTRLTKDLNNFINFLEKYKLQKEISNELNQNPIISSSKKSKI